MARGSDIFFFKLIIREIQHHIVGETDNTMAKRNVLSGNHIMPAYDY
jgi:hypothetical protein